MCFPEIPDSERPAREPVRAPGAVRLPGGDTLLLCRVEDRTGLSHLCVARSANGIDGWRIDARPTLMSSPQQYPEEIWSIEDPRIGDFWIFGPEAPYERSGDVGDVVFPCGQTIGADGDSLHIYYGAADSSVALAPASIRGLLQWLDSNSNSEDGSAI
jgi:predicted GH43/DUF377 family glycosyl hydrolase